MSKRVFPVRMFGMAAAGIAIVGFAVGQVWPGAGVFVVAVASLGWTAIAASRARRVTN